MLVSEKGGKGLDDLINKTSFNDDDIKDFCFKTGCDIKDISNFFRIIQNG